MHRILIAALLVTTSARAYDLRVDSTGALVRWTHPISFHVSPDVTQQLATPGALDAIQTSSHTYDGLANPLTVSVTAGNTQKMGYVNSPGATNENDIVVIDHDWPFDANAIAVTVVTVDVNTHTALDADIAFNAASRTFGIVDPAASPRAQVDDIQNTLTHEIGHAVGLAHNPDLTTCVMYPSASRGETSKRQLSDDDRAGVVALYGGTARSGATSSDPAVGCSATPGFSMVPWVGTLLFLMTRFRRRAVLALVLVPAIAFAEPTAESTQTNAMAVSGRNILATGHVVAARAVELDSALFWTELDLELTACHNGDCPDHLTLRVPGGKRGDLEQYVEGTRVPGAGEEVGVSLQTTASSTTGLHVYRLDVDTERATFLELRSGTGSLSTSP